MSNIDKGIRAILREHLPPRSLLRGGLLPCATEHAVRHIPVASLGQTQTHALGTVYGMCPLPEGRKCANHLKPGTRQMTDDDLKRVRRACLDLNLPMTRGEPGVMYVGPELGVPESKRQRSPETVVKDALVYIKDGAEPIEIPLVCIARGPLVEVVFRQPIACDVLNLNFGDKTNDYQLYNLQIGEFVDWPRAYEKFYVPADDVLIYKQRDVVDCPGLEDLAYGEDGDPPLPSLFDHIVASSPMAASRSWTDASSSARVLRSGNAYGSSEPMSPATSALGSPSRHAAKKPKVELAPVATSSASAGQKRKRTADDAPQKPAKKKWYREESDDDVWLVVCGDLIMLM